MDGVTLPTVPGMQPLPGAPAMPTMPNPPSLPNSFMPNQGTAALPGTPPTPQPPQLPGVSPINAPSGTSPIPPAGSGFLSALRSNLPNLTNMRPSWMQSGPLGGVYSPAAQHYMALQGWQDKLGSAAFGGGMTPGSGLAGYLKNLGGVAASRPAPSPNMMNAPVVGPMLAHLFGPYAGSNNGGSTST